MKTPGRRAREMEGVLRAIPLVRVEGHPRPNARRTLAHSIGTQPKEPETRGKWSPGRGIPGLPILAIGTWIRLQGSTTPLGRLPLRSVVEGGESRGENVPALRPVLARGRADRHGSGRVRHGVKALRPMPLHSGTIGHSGPGAGWMPLGPSRFPFGSVAQSDPREPLPGTGSDRGCAVRLIEHVVDGDLDEGTGSCHHRLIYLPGLAAVQAFHDVGHGSRLRTHSLGKQARHPPQGPRLETPPRRISTIDVRRTVAPCVVAGRSGRRFLDASPSGNA
jgi:hypothetical protein